MDVEIRILCTLTDPRRFTFQVKLDPPFVVLSTHRTWPNQDAAVTAAEKLVRALRRSVDVRAHNGKPVNRRTFNTLGPEQELRASVQQILRIMEKERCPKGKKSRTGRRRT